ncbi:hypothetical protein [Arthrobacter monumenti]
MRGNDEEKPEQGPAQKQGSDRQGQGETIEGGYGGPGPENETISTDEKPPVEDDKTEEPPD